MIEWLDAIECPPNVPGKILVKIDKNYFLAKVYIKEFGSLIFYYPEDIFYELSSTRTIDDIDFSSSGRGWVFPSHYKFPEKYCYIEKQEQ